jgi:hypothetical protein
MVNSDSFPRLLKKAIHAFTNTVPMKHIEEAYKQKFHLKHPMTDGNFRTSKTVSAAEEKELDENALFSKLRFAEKEETNVATV